MKPALVISLFVSLLCVGCDEHVPSNYDLAAFKSVALYDSYYTDSEFVGTIDISPISASLARADWTSKNFMWKGSWRFKTNDGKEIMLSYYGSFFRVVGVPGNFVIRDEDKETYGFFIKKLSQEIVIPWRIKRNAN
jgi:hypothetical protein